MLTVGKFVEAAIKKYSKVSYFKNLLKNLWKQPLQKLLSKSFSETFIRTAFLCLTFKEFFHFLNSLSHKKDHFRIYKLIMVSKTCKTFQNLDTVTYRCSVKEILWKISQHFQESCCMSESLKIIL